MPFTAATRPRISSGVSACTMVWRMTTLIWSAAPLMASISMETISVPDRPKPTMESP